MENPKGGSVGATKHGGGLTSLIFKGVSILFLFAFLVIREVMPMYMTWNVFFQFCTVIIATISLVVSIYHNKKR